jgi:hypothetical protein
MDQLNDINMFLSLYFFESIEMMQTYFEEFNAFIH